MKLWFKLPTHHALMRQDNKIDLQNVNAIGSIIY